MHKKWLVGFSALLLTSALQAGGDHAPVAEAYPNTELKKVQSPRVDELYCLAGVNWGDYHQVLLKPVEVAFAKRWDPRSFGIFGLSDKEVAAIRRDFSRIAEEVFTEVLAEHGYQRVNEAAPGVMALEIDIQDLYLNAPETSEPGRRKVYVRSAGEMRLQLEIRDAVTGTTLALARDKRRDPESQQLQWANHTFNLSRARILLHSWALQLADALAAAREH